MSTYARYIQWINLQPKYEGSLRELKAASADSEPARDTLRLEAMRMAIRVAKQLRARYTPDQSEPDMDMVQEATLAAMTAAETWNPDKGAFPSWVARRAIGAAVDYYKTANNAGLGGKDYVADVEDIESLVMLEYVWDDSDEAITLHDDRLNALAYMPDDYSILEDAGNIAALVSKLPTDLRQTVASYYGYKVPRMTLKEIAKRDGVALSTVRLRLATAVAYMRDDAKLSLLPDSGIT